MGLFTGMSVLRLFEIVFWIARFVFRRKHKEKKHNDTLIEKRKAVKKMPITKRSRLSKRFSRLQRNKVSNSAPP